MRGVSVLDSDSNARWTGQTEHPYNPRSISMTNTSQHQIINMRHVSPLLSTDYLPLVQAESVDVHLEQDIKY